MQNLTLWAVVKTILMKTALLVTYMEDADGIWYKVVTLQTKHAPIANGWRMSSLLKMTLHVVETFPM